MGNTWDIHEQIHAWEIHNMHGKYMAILLVGPLRIYRARPDESEEGGGRGRGGGRGQRGWR